MTASKWKGRCAGIVCAGVAVTFASHVTVSAQDLGQIAGFVIDDINGNGVTEPGEPGLPGVTIELIDFDGDITSAVTDNNGRFDFLELPFGPYVVRQVLESGRQQTSPSFKTDIDPSPPVTGPWDYDDNDGDNEVGPANWISVAPNSAGAFQSPIDLSGSTTDLSQVLRFHYMPTVPEGLRNNGHNAEIEYAHDSDNFAEIDGEQFDLVQFHVHHDSEHSVDGQLEAMELHLVHRHEHGGLAVVGLLLQEGQANVGLADFFTALEDVQGPETEVEFEHEINLLDVLPTSMQGWFYNGSLTTPPATQGVNWFVLEEPIEVSPEQLEQFEAFLASIDLEMNNRPVLPLNGRQLNQLNFQVAINDESPMLMDFASVVPEPGTAISLIAFGLIGGCFLDERRRSI